MRRAVSRLSACLGSAAIVSLACAVVLAAHAATAHASDQRRSGFDEMSPSSQAMQRDDLQNPGMLSVAEGEALWSAAPARGGRSCADCHGDAAETMRGVAARYPAWDADAGAASTLGARIDRCRVRHQRADSGGPEDAQRLALEAYVGHQSRGLPIAPPEDARMTVARARGEALWRTRFGQLGVSCAQCHDDRAGLRLGASPIPQAHPTGYPIYRLEWQSIGSLQRRLRNCMVGVRATPFAPDSADATALEAWLAVRAAGMRIETPAVRP
ncbi:MAG: sulfur oxidation c-type cytochrome SoxA [Lautropia sp.]